MLLGCCHCGETPSESIPPSVSESQSESGSNPPPTTTGCSECTGGVAPLRYKLSVSTTSTNLCAQNYIGDYILSLDQSGGTCFWKSAELPLIRLGLPGDCLEHSGCAINGWRWQVSLETWLGSFNIRATAFQWNGSACVQYINMTGTQDTTATIRNCLAGVSLSGTIAGVAVTGVLAVAP
jgi:hypothetical protein